MREEDAAQGVHLCVATWTGTKTKRAPYAERLRRLVILRMWGTEGGRERGVGRTVSWDSMSRATTSESGLLAAGRKRLTDSLFLWIVMSIRLNMADDVWIAKGASRRNLSPKVV